MILFTVDANFIDEMKIGRQFPGLMKFYNKICFINIDLFQMWCLKAWICKFQISFNLAVCLKKRLYGLFVIFLNTL